MELRAYMAILRRRWWLLLLGAILGGGCGYFYSQAKVPLYRSQTTLMVGRFIESANPGPGEVATGQQLARSYADLARRELILQATKAALEIDIEWSELKKKVGTRPVLDTHLLEIAVTDTDPRRARRIAGEINRQLILQSPAGEVDQEQEAYRTFAKIQLADLQANITAGRQQLQNLQAALEIEVTEAGIRRRRAELEAMQTRLDTWQSNYAGLLSFTQATQKEINVLTVIEVPSLPAKPINATTERDIALATVVGIMLAAGLVYLLETLDDTIRTIDDVQQILNLVVLGAIPKIKRDHQQGKKGHRPAGRASTSPAAEAYRALRTNIQFSSLIRPNPARSLLVTSTGSREGKSTTVANLAAANAQSGKRVILVDSDLRRPVQHRLFGVPNRIGLTSLLVDRQLSLETALQQTGIDNLQVLPSGPLPSNAADILACGRLEQLMAQLAGQADLVLFDSPPLLAVSDASILATHVGGTILVIEAARTRREVFRRGRQILSQVGISPLGVVLNRFNPGQDTCCGDYPLIRYPSEANLAPSPNDYIPPQST